MNKKNFTLIIILLVTSLVSILFVQFNWISDLNRLNEDRFKQDVQHVLYMINERLEEKEIINYVSSRRCVVARGNHRKHEKTTQKPT